MKWNQNGRFEFLAAAEKSTRVSVLASGLLLSCPPMGSLSQARLGRLRGGEEPQGTKGRGEREEKTSQLGPFVFGQIPGL